ncbi:MAG: tetratricopeptide repeat protein [Dehalococcoidia bacterium]|nr:tetratricopeptide repeat protein [Dehalococcoidia bacterium]
MPLLDSPPVKELIEALRSWEKPALPPGLAGIEKWLYGVEKPGKPGSRYAVQILDWLYAFVRLNVKRGPIFLLEDILTQRRADCLAYCKLFVILGRRVGLDCGVVDVVIDSGGRYVPHTAVMVKLTGDKPRFIDLWYGSRDIRHRRLGLRVKEGRRWVVKDVDYAGLKHLEVKYLPDTCVDGITLYVLGNRHLNRGELKEAVRCYDRALTLYSENVRPYYNRAIAYEMLGENERAQKDYADAFRDKDALIRTMAREHPEITDLMQLDIKEVDEQAQEIYLLRQGIITGRRVSLAAIACKFGQTEREVEATLLQVTEKLKGNLT